MSRVKSIHSTANPRVKHWASLLERKHRDREGKFLAEGIHLVQEALLSGAEIETIVFAESRGLPDELAGLLPSQMSGSRQSGGPGMKATELIAVSDEVMARCSETVTPQGVFAVVRKPAVKPEHILERSRSLVIAVDGVQDPGNLGTIIRSADAVGASAVLLGRGTVDLYNAKTIRSTMGSLFHLPIAECDLLEWLPKARALQVQIIAAHLAEARSCYELDYSGDTWFVVGNEGQGVSPAVLKHATSGVIIPMPGRAESLNVAMAATVLLFEAMRQRMT